VETEEIAMKRAALLLVLAALLPSASGAATVDATQVWRPMYSFIGSWKGTRPAAEGTVKVTRVYASAETNHHLQITEKAGGGAAAVWGTVNFDAELGALVLRHLAPDGSTTNAAYDAAASTEDKLVFESPAADPTRTRITYERSGWNNFVERVELASGGGAYTVASETKFERN
jgi:hypothetical protein